MAVTIKDVAREAGVAACTISFAMNGSAHVADATKKRIFEAIEKLNYRPNQSARGLVKKKTNNIGLAISEVAEGLENSLLLEVIKGMGKAASEKNYDLLISFQKKKDDESHILDVYRKQSADGLILMGTKVGERPYKELLKHRFPFVLLGRPYKPGACSSVNADNSKAAYDGARYLIDKGHRRIGFITPCSLDYDAAQDRLEGYRQAMSDFGLDVQEDWIGIGSFDPSSGEKEAEAFLLREDRCTAILAGRDTIAANVIKRSQQLGFKVPSDVMVLSFDDSTLTQTATPSISALRMPMMQMGFESASLLIRMIEGEMSFEEANTILLPCEIIPRTSTAD
ncbi:MAG: LacI family DNA-binding transcriptional regulator [Paenibacillaceae bacterium]